MKTNKKTKTPFLLFSFLIFLSSFVIACAENFIMPERPDPALANFTPVKEITGIPSTSLPYAELLLKAKLTPPDATNRKIYWSVTDASNGEEPAAVQSSRLILGDGEGTITLTALIKNGAAPGVDYTQDFEIKVSY